MLAVGPPSAVVGCCGVLVVGAVFACSSASAASSWSSSSLLLQWVSVLSLSSCVSQAPSVCWCSSLAPCGELGGGWWRCCCCCCCVGSPHVPLGCLCLFRRSAQSVGWSGGAFAGCSRAAAAAARLACLRSLARWAFCSLLRVLCSPLPSCLFLARLALASSNVSPSLMYQWDVSTGWVSSCRSGGGGVSSSVGG